MASTGAVSITAGGDITTNTVTGRTGVTFNAPNVNINGPLATAATLNLAQVSGNVTVLSQGTIATGRANGVVDQPTGNGVIWAVSSGSDSGNGTLRNAMAGVNAFQGKSQISLNNITVNVSTALPAVSRQLRLTGSNAVIDGQNLVAAAPGLTIVANGTVVDGITLRNFNGAGIYLSGGRSAATNVTLSNLTLSRTLVGIQAINNLGGSTLSNLTIDGQGLSGSYGILLSNAQGLTVGNDTSSSVRVSNVSIGLLASGNLAGTNIAGLAVQSLVGQRVGISLASATNLQLTTSNKNMISDADVGILAAGFSQGTTITKSNLTFANVTTPYNVKASRNLILN